MANTNAPRGFAPRRTNAGEAWSSTLNTYKLPSGYATTLATGDVVKFLSTGYVAKAAPGDQIRGIVAGVKYTDATGRRLAAPLWSGGTVTYLGKDAEVMVMDNPNGCFEAQFTNSAAVPVQADVGATFNLFDSGASLAQGLSGEGIDYTTLGTGALQFRFIGFSTRPDNDTTSAYSYGLFVPALHDFRVNTGI